eukprot:3891189-Pleurochrysis_carterae.AAC.1
MVSASWALNSPNPSGVCVVPGMRRCAGCRYSRYSQTRPEQRGASQLRAKLGKTEGASGRGELGEGA